MIAKVNNIELYYEKSGQGKPLILLHGNGETHKIFKRTISILNKHYTVYAVDFRNHGKSTQVSELHYADHVKDIYEFIVQMQIEKPVCYGFSDGGIVGLLLASEYPDLFSRLIVSGPNISPYGLKNSVRCYYKLYFALTGSSMIKMMLNEPNISTEKLSKIRVPVHITAGMFDLISQKHIRKINDSIKNSTLKIYNFHTHGSYIVNSKKIGEYILEVSQ